MRKGIALALLVLFTAVLGTTGTVGCAERLTRWQAWSSEALGEHREDGRYPSPAEAPERLGWPSGPVITDPGGAARDRVFVNRFLAALGTGGERLNGMLALGAPEAASHVPGPGAGGSVYLPALAARLQAWADLPDVSGTEELKLWSDPRRLIWHLPAATRVFPWLDPRRAELVLLDNRDPHLKYAVVRLPETNVFMVIRYSPLPQGGMAVTGVCDFEWYFWRGVPDDLMVLSLIREGRWEELSRITLAPPERLLLFDGQRYRPALASLRGRLGETVCVQGGNVFVGHESRSLRVAWVWVPGKGYRVACLREGGAYVTRSDGAGPGPLAGQGPPGPPEALVALGGDAVLAGWQDVDEGALRETVLAFLANWAAERWGDLEAMLWPDAATAVAWSRLPGGTAEYRGPPVDAFGTARALLEHGVFFAAPVPWDAPRVVEVEGTPPARARVSFPGTPLEINVYVPASGCVGAVQVSCTEGEDGRGGQVLPPWCRMEGRAPGEAVEPYDPVARLRADLPPWAWQARVVGAADYDGDGRDELALTQCWEFDGAPPDITVWFAECRDGRLVEFARLPAPPLEDGAWTGELFWGDFTRDGRAEMLLPIEITSGDPGTDFRLALATLAGGEVRVHRVLPGFNPWLACLVPGERGQAGFAVWESLRRYPGARGEHRSGGRSAVTLWRLRGDDWERTVVWQSSQELGGPVIWCPHLGKLAWQGEGRLYLAPPRGGAPVEVVPVPQGRDLRCEGDVILLSGGDRVSWLAGGQLHSVPGHRVAGVWPVSDAGERAVAVWSYGEAGPRLQMYSLEGEPVEVPGALRSCLLARHVDLDADGLPELVGVEQHPATGYDRLLARLCLWARDGGVWHVRRAGSFVPGFWPTAVLVANLDGGCPELVVSGVLRADSYPGVVLTLRPEAASNGAR